MPGKISSIFALIAKFGGPIALQILAVAAPGALPLAQLILGVVSKASDFLEGDAEAQALSDEQLAALVEKDEADLLKNLDADIARLEIKLAEEKIAKMNKAMPQAKAKKLKAKK